jgi:hypothetical protein|nr:MAG TPA: Nin one binding (NOB1) Zn-ribbon like [Caudoviricetes sp.]
MTIQEIIESIIHSLIYNDDSIPTTQDDLQTIKEALEKQIPKKPYKTKEHKQNNWYCSTCKCYCGDDMELQYACLQPKFCEHCGQALDWSECNG